MYDEYVSERLRRAAFFLPPVAAFAAFAVFLLGVLAILEDVIYL
jgi:hypothetical protein